MKTILGAAIASVFSLTIAGSALAADPSAPKPIVVSDKVTVKATVVSIDHANRLVGLKTPDGDVTELYVDESVTRFKNLKVGDLLTAEYYESVAYDIKKPGSPVPPDKIITESGKLTGPKPGGGLTDTTVSTVTIVAIDRAIPAVTIRTSDGEIKDYRVIHKEYLNDVKVGDVVQVTRKKALMIAVDSPK